MRYLKPHFYDKFVCTAGDCPDTCCAGWQIMIDDASLEKYKNVQGEFGKRLHGSVNWEEECFCQNERRCAFLNDENLCDLYKALGPDALCDTCRLYPRHTEEWKNLGEQLLMFFVYTYFCGAVYDDMVCSKMELALFSVRWIQEFLIVRWLENGKKLSMQDVEEISWRYAREIEHSDDNLNALEDWLFGMYAPEGCQLAKSDISKGQNSIF